MKSVLQLCTTMKFCMTVVMQTFIEKDIKKNTWKAVAEKLGLEDGEFLLNQSNV